MHVQVVALKFIPKVGKSEGELRSLEQEIHIMATLSHPHIVTLYDCQETDQEVHTVRVHLTITRDLLFRCVW